MENKVDLRPMRIGEIIDRGISLVPRLVGDPSILILLVLSAGVAAGANHLQLGLQQDADLGRKILLIGSWLFLFVISIVVSQCFTALTVIKGGALWIGDNRGIGDNEGIGGSKTIRIPKDNFTPQTLFRLVGLNFYIAFVSILLVFLFVIPSLIYYFNRALAPVILLIEDLNIKGAIKKSMRLMTFHPELSWYSSRTPMMRISGLLFVMWIINLLPGVLAGASTGAFTAQMSGQAPGPPTAFQFILVFLSQLVVFSAIALGTLTLVGFYFDLRLRCEGFDLQDQAQAAAARAAQGTRR